MSFQKLVVVLFLSVAVSVNALATPHAFARSAHHHAIAARVAAPAPLEVPVAPLRRRQNSKRCKSKSTSSVVAAPSTSAVVSSSAAVVVPSSTPVPAVAPVAAAPLPAIPASSSAKPAASPKPATSAAPAAPAPAKTTTAAKPASGNLPSFMTGTQTGQGTFYGTGLGACGITNNDNQFIAAASKLLFDKFPGYAGGNPNNNPMCGRTVTAHYQGKSVQVTLTDRCEACEQTDLDFSPAAFNKLADPSVGRISGMTWTWDS